MSLLIRKINQFLENTENRITLLAFSLLVGVCLLGIDMLCVTPNFVSGFSGLQYANLSEAPFDFHTPNPIRYRILPPLVGYLTGLRGNHFFLIPLIFAGLLITAIYYTYRKNKTNTPLETLGITGLIVFSCVMQIQLVAAGYTDAAYFFFVFLTFSTIRRPYLSAVFYALGLLSHESCLFLFPFLVLYHKYLFKKDPVSTARYGFFLVLAIIPMGLYRYWVNKHIAVVYDLPFYFSESNIRLTLEKVRPRAALGLLLVFRSFWILVVYAFYKMFRRKDYSLLFVLTVLLLCVLAQLFIAYDITRMLCLCFPLMLICAREARKDLSETKFLIFIALLILANILIPEYMMTCDGAVRL